MSKDGNKSNEYHDLSISLGGPSFLSDQIRSEYLKSSNQILFPDSVSALSYDPLSRSSDIQDKETNDKIKSLETEVRILNKNFMQATKDIAQVQKEISEAQSTNKKIVSNLTDAAKNYEKEYSKMEKSVDNLQKDKMRLIEILGIFVAIFTFVSVEINILKTAESFYQIAGLSLLMFSGISLFIFLLFLVTEIFIWGSDTKYKKSGLLLFSCACFLPLLVGLTFIYLGSRKQSLREPESEAANVTNFIIPDIKVDESVIFPTSTEEG